MMVAVVVTATVIAAVGYGGGVWTADISGGPIGCDTQMTRDFNFEEAARL